MSDSDLRSFHIGDLLTVATGHLFCPTGVDGLYALLDHLGGQPHYTHQLVRAMDDLRPWLLRQHPWLADLEPPGDGVEPAAWLADAQRHYGEWHDVHAVPLGAYLGREPVAELREMRPDAEILIIDPREGR